MAEDPLAVADLIADAFDLADIEVSDLLKASPLVQALMMEPSSNGTTHKYTKETGAPVVGFRSVNDGREIDSSIDTLVSVDLKVLDFSWRVDVALAEAWRKGREDLIAREGMRHIKAAMLTFEKQLINGTLGASDSAGASGYSTGFAGFRDAATINGTTDAMVVNAAGTTADTASSVYGIRLANDGVCGVYRGDGTPFSLMETVLQETAGSTGTYPAYYTPGCTWLGVQVGGAYDMGRIVNLTADSSKGLTDDLIAELLSKFPVGYGPTHLVMSRRSLKQLQDSRTATTTTGAPAPFPQESFGVSIVVSDAVSDTEELVA